MKRYVKSSNVDADYYFGKEEYEEFGALVKDALSGQLVSKSFSDADVEPIGLKYNAELLGFDDEFKLLRTIEGLCYNGEAVEIDDSTYRIL